MEVALNPEMRSLVEELVRSGRFTSPEDVLHAGLTSLMQQERLARLPLVELEKAVPDLRQKVATGLTDAGAGRVVDGESFFDALEREDQTPDAGRKTA
jgi:putative addiction module CopG family antidote